MMEHAIHKAAVDGEAGVVLVSDVITFESVTSLDAFSFLPRALMQRPLGSGSWRT